MIPGGKDIAAAVHADARGLVVGVAGTVVSVHPQLGAGGADGSDDPIVRTRADSRRVTGKGEAAIGPHRNGAAKIRSCGRRAVVAIGPRQRAIGAPFPDGNIAAGARTDAASDTRDSAVRRRDSGYDFVKVRTGAVGGARPERCAVRGRVAHCGRITRRARHDGAPTGKHLAIRTEAQRQTRIGEIGRAILPMLPRWCGDDRKRPTHGARGIHFAKDRGTHRAHERLCQRNRRDLPRDILRCCKRRGQRRHGADGAFVNPALRPRDIVTATDAGEVEAAEIPHAARFIRER